MSSAALAVTLAATLGATPAFANGRVQPSTSAPALQSVSDSVGADKRGFGDDQFDRFVSSSRAQPARVPSLAAIYASSAPTRPRAFGDGALPLAQAVSALPVIPSDNSSLALGWPGAVAPAGLPLRNARLTSQFGLRSHPILGGMRVHSGVDLAAPMATPIRATGDGVVTRASWAGGYGLLVSIRHKDGVETRYGHMSRLAVEPGQRVTQNAVIGYVGSTGRSTGPHVHYEVLVKGRAVNPLRAPHH
jgi:murein DD-endopeptidase MepM/ murein hydrolase activator NlpD